MAEPGGAIAMADPKRNIDERNIIRIEPGTLLVIITVLLLVPLLLTGFLSQ
ncbi:MAG: hypothetical protein AAFY26_06810 [Cyanobacteria bacterium J06638_22]